MDVCEELQRVGWDVCWDCGVRTGMGNMDAHMAGRKHQERMDLLYCGICDVCIRREHAPASARQAASGISPYVKAECRLLPT